MDPATLAHIRDTHQIDLTDHQSVSGGDISQAFRSGDHFIKTNHPSSLFMFEAEAFALKTLAKTHTVRIPQSLANGASETHSYHILEYLPLQPLTAQANVTLGHQLAQLHQHTAPEPGFPLNNTIGATPQNNEPRPTWLEFWRDQRLAPLFQRLAKRGKSFPQSDLLLDNLDQLLPANPEHSLLHGDLWAGNAACLPDHTPVLFDPASYYGHRETDLAMTQLFGGFSHQFYQAYESVSPPEPGHELRTELYNLYHLLNHNLLFGDTYRNQCLSIVQQLSNSIT
ncbi:MAG: fructosamine kinase family protein [Verrucomicrobiota bacterium]